MSRKRAKIVNIKFTPQEDSRLRAVAEHQCVSMSRIIRDALQPIIGNDLLDDLAEIQRARREAK